MTNASRPTTLPFFWLSKLFYSNNAAREAFVELCESEYVQKVTFDSYLYKKVRPLADEFLVQVGLEAVAVRQSCQETSVCPLDGKRCPP